MIGEEKKKQFEELREALRKEIVFLYSCDSVYGYLLDIKGKEVELLNYAPGFFHIVLESLWGSLIHTVYKLGIDKDERSFTMNRYLNFVKNNKDLFITGRISESDFNKMLKEDERRLEELAPTLGKIKERRHKYFAHCDEKYISDISRLHMKHPISKSEFKGVLDIFGEILNRYSNAYDGLTMGLLPTGIYDISAVIDLIRQEKERQKGKYEELIGNPVQ